MGRPGGAGLASGLNYKTSYCAVYGKAHDTVAAGKVNMPDTAPEALPVIKQAEPRPDVDLTDGTFYSGDSRSAYR
jgi:hypothetical protein